MAYDVYMDGILLPVTPGKISMKTKNQNKTMTLINEGEINIPKQAGLTDVSFTALFPQTQYPFARYPNGFKPARFYLELLKRLKGQVDVIGRPKPFRLIISRTSPDGKPFFSTNFDEGVTLEDWSFADDWENGTDISVTINLKQYKNYGTKVLTPIVPTSSAQRARPSTSSTSAKNVLTETKERPEGDAPEAKSYTVVSGDTLWGIAKMYLGNGERYPEIYDLNKSVIDQRNEQSGATRYTIYPGQVLTLS